MILSSFPLTAVDRQSVCMALGVVGGLRAGMHERNAPIDTSSQSPPLRTVHIWRTDSEKQKST